MVLGAALVIDGLALSRIRSGEAVPTELTEVVHPTSRCLTSDDPSNLLPIGVVGRNVTRECRLAVDLGGYSHDLSRGATVRRGRNAAWQQVVLRCLGSGELALATRFDQGRGLTAATTAEIESWPMLMTVEGFELRQPPN
jgi:alpha-1,2-mannosyltransferase